MHAGAPRLRSRVPISDADAQDDGQKTVKRSSTGTSMTDIIRLTCENLGGAEGI